MYTNLVNKIKNSYIVLINELEIAYENSKDVVEKHHIRIQILNLTEQSQILFGSRELPGIYLLAKNLDSKLVCNHKPTEYYINGIRYFQCSKCGTPMK